MHNAKSYVLVLSISIYRFKKTFILAGKKSNPPKEDTVNYDANSGNIDDVLEQLRTAANDHNNCQIPLPLSSDVTP